MKPGGLLRSTAVVGALTLLAKCSGIVKMMIIGSYFGTSAEMDAFIVASTILGLAVAWIEKPIRVVVVPFVTRAMAETGEQGVWQRTSQLLNGAIVLFVGAAVVEAVIGPFLAAILAPGLRDGSEIAGRLVQLLAIALVLQGIARFLSAVSHAHGRFARPGLTSTVENLVVVLAVALLAPMLGIWGLATATILGGLAAALMLTPTVWAHRRDYRLRVDLQDPALRRMASLGLPLMLGSGGAHLGQVSDRFFASLLPAGRLSAMAYARQLTYGPLQLLATPLVTVLFPFLAHAARAEDYGALSRKLGRALNLLFIAVLPLSIAIGVLHEPLVRLVYERGAFTPEATRFTADTVLVYALGLPAFTVAMVVSYAFYSINDTRTPVTLGLVRLALKLVLSVVLVRPFAHVGLALAESLSYCIKAVLLLALFPDQLRGATYPRVVRSFVMTAVAGAGMTLVLTVVVPAVTPLSVIQAFTAAPLSEVVTLSALGAAAYLALSAMFQPVEVRDLYRLVRAGLRRRA